MIDGEYFFTDSSHKKANANLCCLEHENNNNNNEKKNTTKSGIKLSNYEEILKFLNLIQTLYKNYKLSEYFILDF